MWAVSAANQLSLNDLLGGRGWWLVKGAQVRGPFLLPQPIKGAYDSAIAGCRYCFKSFYFCFK